MAGKKRPSGVATAKPGRERWALEELWDIVTEADPGGVVAETRFRGVYLLLSDPRLLARAFTQATPAFVKMVLITPRYISLRHGLQGGLKLESCSDVRLRLRGSSKYSEGAIAALLSGAEKCIVYAEGVDDIIFIARGHPRTCGHGCTLILDESLL
ncbi:MAG: hypothetical protein LRS46_02060 [Desulfurococcales archaeon]|nr:hypothetical protein [Desulfurococcales archaeon]